MKSTYLLLSQNKVLNRYLMSSFYSKGSSQNFPQRRWAMRNVCRSQARKLTENVSLLLWVKLVENVSWFLWVFHVWKTFTTKSGPIFLFFSLSQYQRVTAKIKVIKTHCEPPPQARGALGNRSGQEWSSVTAPRIFYQWRSVRGVS